MLGVILMMIIVLVFCLYGFMLSTASSAEEDVLSYHVHVQNTSGEHIANAQVKLTIEGYSPIIEYSDSAGLVRIIIPIIHEGHKAKLSVQARGYQDYWINVDIYANTLPNIIQLSKP